MNGVFVMVSDWIEVVVGVNVVYVDMWVLMGDKILFE